MPDQFQEKIQEGNKNPIENEISELERQLAEKKALLEKEKPLDKVVLDEKKPVTTPLPTIQVAPPLPQEKIKEHAQALNPLEKNQQLKGLVDLAFEKGVDYAVEVAQKMDNPYLLDEFHDVMVDKLREELVKKGKLEEI